MTAVSLPLTFRALGCTEENPALIPLEKTISSLAEDEVMVRVAFASLNPMDPKIQQRIFNIIPFPVVVGYDFSGTVVAVGGPSSMGAEAIEVGSEVFGKTSNGGCFAEYVVAKRVFLALRKTVPAMEGSTYGIAYLTAYESVEITAEISKCKDQWIYIAGGAGGVGHFAVQLAKMWGLKVISTASKPESIALLKQLGVDHVIDYSKQDVVQEVLRLTGGKGSEVVYDPSYQLSSYKQSASVVASGGRWIKLGPWLHTPDGQGEVEQLVAQRGATVIIGDLGRYSVHFGQRDPHYLAQQPRITQALRDAAQWYEEGKVRPHVTEVVPFVAAALQRAFDNTMKGKGNVGKLVVQVAQ